MSPKTKHTECDIEYATPTSSTEDHYISSQQMIENEDTKANSDMSCCSEQQKNNSTEDE